MIQYAMTPISGVNNSAGRSKHSHCGIFPTSLISLVCSYQSSFSSQPDISDQRAALTHQWPYLFPTATDTVLNNKRTLSPACLLQLHSTHWQKRIDNKSSLAHGHFPDQPA